MRFLIIFLFLAFSIETYAKEKTFFGPFFKYEKTDSIKIYAFRPLFYYKKNYELKFSSIDIVYPVIGYSKDNQQTQFNALFRLVKYSSFTSYDSTVEKTFEIFPILDTTWGGNKEKNYFSLFPLFGSIKGKYSKEKINYFIFPLYMKTVKKNSYNTHFLWPFFSKTSGKYSTGFKIWPLYGYTKKVDNETLLTVKESKFYLWPFFTFKKDQTLGINLEENNYWPIYLSSNSELYSSRTWLWPFFNVYENKLTGQKTYNMPWPIIQYKSGANIKSKRFFPLYSYSKNKHVEKGFIVWPIYRYKNEILASEYFTTQSFLFFLYKEDKFYSIEKDEVIREFSSLWPIYSMDSDQDGYDFRIFAPIESFFSKNTKIREIWSPLWSVVRVRSNQSESSTSLLFNFIKFERDKINQSSEFSINLLIPLVSNYSNKDSNEFNILGGFLGFKTGEDAKIRILYIPIEL